ncbi:MAG: radical SAM protein [bacterium]|nr:radical SAM protein [bacterium]
MKILFLRPVTPGAIVLNLIPPIGIGYLAAVSRNAGYEVALLDCILKNLDYAGFEKELKNIMPDVVAMTAFSHDIPSARKTTAIIKKVNPEIKVIIGGPHSSGMPGDTLNILDNVDFAFKGEAERSIVKLLKFIEKKEGSLENIKGLIWRNGDKININEQDFPENLDEIPYPAWDLMEPGDYPDAPQGVIFRKTPVAPLVITRGCPFRCTFCAGWTVTGKKIRTRSLGNVQGEIELLYKKYGVREIHVLDDNFSMNIEFVRGFCDWLIGTGWNISWCCPNGLRCDTLDEDTVKLMKKSGCYYISIGIESGSDRILKNMKKGLLVEKIKEQVKMITGAGMDVNGFFILGYPGETEEDIRKTIDFSKELKLTRAAFYSYMPLPGTESYETLLKLKEIQAIDFGKMTEMTVAYTPRGMSRERLKELQRKAHLEFYLRPEIMFKLLKEIKSVNQLKYIAKRAKAYLFDG